VICSIDQRANGRMESNTNKTADRQHRSNRRLIPVRLRQQENPDIGTQTTADISQKEVQVIERGAVEHET